MNIDRIGAKYYVLRESYWDKSEKKYKKIKFYLGEYPILTESLERRIERAFGKKLTPKIKGWFGEKLNEARNKVLKTVISIEKSNGLDKSVIPESIAKIAYALNGFDQDWLRETCGIAVVNELKYRTRSVMYLQDNNHCHYFYRSSRFCDKPISKTSLNLKTVLGHELTLPYCDKHRMGNSGWWTEGEWDQFRKEH